MAVRGGSPSGDFGAVHVGLTVKLTQDWARQALARAVTGSYWDKDAGWWLLLDPNPRQAAVALRVFPELALEYPALVELRDQLLEDARPFDCATPYDRHVEAPRTIARMAEL